MKKIKFEILLKCILTGVIYGVTTCIIQVPVANVLYSVLNIQADALISDDMLPVLLLAICIIGMTMALFYYLNGHLFVSDSKWKQGIKFGIFVYVSNYIPQVFFLDANKGFRALMNGGFPVIQVELFDFVILMITVLLMVTYMPCRFEKIPVKNKAICWKYILCACAFTAILVVLQEVLLPRFGVSNMASGLKVSAENLPFFYGVMIVGFMIAGILVSRYTFTAKKEGVKERFCIEYGILIWCTFDLTMIPLGFGIMESIIFIIISMMAFAGVEILCRYLSE